MKKFLLTAALLLTVVSGFAQEKKDSTKKSSEYEFTVIKENPITSIKDQYRSGTCWCFSALSFLESEIMKEKGIDSLDLSEMFVVSRSYHDRGIKYVRLDGHLNFGAGSSFGDVLHVVKDYGIVPQEAMPGLNYGTEKPEHSEMDAALKGYVDAIVENPNRTLTTAWVNGLDGILSAYLGEIPSTFEVDGVEYTPETYRDYLGINPDDYVSLTSFTHHPFYSPFIIEVCDNWRWDASYNLPLDELMEVMYNAISEGYTIAWGSDVSEMGFSRTGVATVPDVDRKPGAGSDQERWIGKSEDKEAAPSDGSQEEKVITQEMRQDGYDRKTTTDDHGMQIYGIAQDQDGNKFFMVKNSWGDAGKYKGVWYVSDAFVRYKTMNIVVNRNAIPKDIRKKLGIK
ncbi:MAG: aminopeptidase [Bacteroidetes bacterium]|uniref:Aminopeptidase n=1 Tax=Candidatus Cryptobacteroides merdigallinarum TaxID=2840770 RepID=A0A9D9EJT2_9BACT|nr:aminopeptidase [Candidatus Cryptobacteroides merdigallinarum]